MPGLLSSVPLKDAPRQELGNALSPSNSMPPLTGTLLPPGQPGEAVHDVDHAVGGQNVRQHDGCRADQRLACRAGGTAATVDGHSRTGGPCGGHSVRKDPERFPRSSGGHQSPTASIQWQTCSLGGDAQPLAPSRVHSAISSQVGGRQALLHDGAQHSLVQEGGILRREVRYGVAGSGRVLECERTVRRGS